VQVTDVVPSWNTEPLAGEHVVDLSPEYLSDDVTENVADADGFPEVGVVVMVLGQVMFGKLVSATLTAKEHELIFAALSLAVQVTVFVPSENEDPLDGEHDWEAIPEASDDVKAHVAVVDGTPPVGVTEIGLGQLTVGGTLSKTSMTNEQELTFNALSIAVQVTVVVPRLKSPGL
jgi:hypothetical protein